MIGTSVRIREVTQPNARELAELGEVLIDCVEGGASVSFLWPMTRAKADAFWESAMASLQRGERRVLVAENAQGEIIGTVTVILNLPENQPHRGDVAKMLVRRSARRLGLGARLMRAAEDAALAAGRTLLVLDTVTGGDAERLYQRLGWTRVGVVPDYALWPDGRLCDTTFFYKRLVGLARGRGHFLWVLLMP